MTMSVLSRTFPRISSFRITVTEIKWKLVPRINFSSNITPIKMAVEVYQSNATDPIAPPLIIMHGLFGSRQNLRGICKNLESKSKRKIYNVDARNHGESPHDSAHSSAHMAADVFFLMQEQKLKRVSVMGHSLGGRGMMFFALKHPELIEKAVIMDVSPISIPPSFQNLDDIFMAMKNVSVPSNLSLKEGRKIAERKMIEAIGDEETVNFLMMNFKKSKSGEFTWALNIAALHSNFNYIVNEQFSGMPPFTGPVLFVGGKHSNFINSDDWPKIKEIFPNAELKWLDSGHLVHFEQPLEFVELVTSFLKN